MPNKWLITGSLASLLAIQTNVHAVWSSKKQVEKPNDTTVQGTHVPDDRHVFIEADYLFWVPTQENLVYASKATVTGIGNGGGGSNISAINGRIKTPSFDLSSGVRLGIGAYNSDSWDINARVTYFYSDTKSTHHADLQAGQALLPAFVPLIFGSVANKTTAYWQLNTWIFDLTFGREYFLTNRFTIHPYIGLRGVIFDQTFRTTYAATFTASSSTTKISEDHTSSIHMHNDFGGAGPRAGLDSSFYLSKQWSLLGGVSGTVYYSQYKVKSNGNGFNGTSGGPTNIPAIKPISVNYKDKHNLIRANMDAYFGLGWDHWYNNGKNRVYLALVAEGSYWWGINQLCDTDLTLNNDNNNNNNNNNNDFSLIFQKRNGDLALFGGTFHFQLDF
jgi:hypothetical protein